VDIRVKIKRACAVKKTLLCISAKRSAKLIHNSQFIIHNLATQPYSVLFDISAKRSVKLKTLMKIRVPLMNIRVKRKLSRNLIS